MTETTKFDCDACGADISFPGDNAKIHASYALKPTQVFDLCLECWDEALLFLERRPRAVDSEQEAPDGP